MQLCKITLVLKGSAALIFMTNSGLNSRAPKIQSTLKENGFYSTLKPTKHNRHISSDRTQACLHVAGTYIKQTMYSIKLRWLINRFLFYFYFPFYFQVFKSMKMSNLPWYFHEIRKYFFHFQVHNAKIELNANLWNHASETKKLFVLKFGYSEKATKFEKIFHLKFDPTQ